MISAVLIGTVKTLAISMLSEKMLCKLLVLILQYVVPKTKNSLDDKLLAMVEKKLQQDGIIDG